MATLIFRTYDERQNFANAVSLAIYLQRIVKDQMRGITCSIGIAESKVLSRQDIALLVIDFITRHYLFLLVPVNIHI